MNEMSTELLLWARSTGWIVAMVLFVGGLSLRCVEIFWLGRPIDLSTPRASERQGSPWHTVFRRFLPYPGLWRRAAITHVGGYLFHIGFFAVLLLGGFHIQWFKSLLGFGWPALPTPVIDSLGMMAILSLLALLICRITHPVKRFISRFGDYLAWGLSMLPLLTGWLATHHVGPYVPMLVAHLLSVELLLALLPFTNLLHTFTIFAARWYTGDIYGRKGVQA